jgi:hypothetical protein
MTMTHEILSALGIAQLSRYLKAPQLRVYV